MDSYFSLAWRAETIHREIHLNVNEGEDMCPSLFFLLQHIIASYREDWGRGD
jgi:hypothetical protein